MPNFWSLPIMLNSFNVSLIIDSIKLRNKNWFHFWNIKKDKEGEEEEEKFIPFWISCPFIGNIFSIVIYEAKLSNI